jgi:alanine dehydrogenase
MARLSIGVAATSHKENEFRLPIHPRHFGNLDRELLDSIYLEEGYGSRFDVSQDELKGLVAGIRTREQLIDECDVIVLPKPLPEDLSVMREGQILWGWPHCVQDEALTQQAIDRKLTLIAWEAMNHWGSDGSFSLHVFHKNNELAGYCSVMHALTLRGLNGQYGRKLNAAVISFGATGRGAVTALASLGIHEVTVFTQREPAAVASPVHSATIVQFEAEGDDRSKLIVDGDDGRRPLTELLAEYDVIVNCVLQDPDAPYTFVRNEDLAGFDPATLIVDVSCDLGMGFDWATPTSFEDPMFEVGEGVHYYAVDHSPSLLWDAATWEISDALLPYLPVVMDGPGAWDSDDTIKKAIEIRGGVVQNPKILSFQNRSAGYPHEKLG